MVEETKAVANGVDIDTRLASLRARKAELDAAREQAAKVREARMLEVEIEFTEKLGELHEAFEIVDAGAEGPIVLKLGDGVLHKAFNAAIDKNKAKRGGDGITEEACSQFVMPCIAYPEKQTALDIFGRRPGLIFACAGKLSALFSTNEAGERGK